MADNDNNMSQQSQQPQLCKQSCGFYGNPNFDGMCSKCYKDYVQRKSNTTGVVGRASPNPNSSAERASLSAAFVNAVNNAAPKGYSVEDVRALIKAESRVEGSLVHSVSASISSEETSNSGSDLIATASTDAQLVDAGAKKTVAEVGASGTATSAQASGSNNDQPAQANAPQKMSNRCDTCKKKVGLTGFGCRCGGTFCGEHRYSDRHACQFDYKQHGAQQLRKLNPVVVADKVTKI